MHGKIPAADSHTPPRIFLGLGSNLGDREENLRGALVWIAALPGTEVVRVSRFRETAPWGVTEQRAFLNAVTEIRTELDPEALLRVVKAIEVEMGRVRTYRWGPRLIDIDILLYGEVRLETPELTLPHPQILERPFVREPLAEIAPEIVETLHAALPL